MIRITLAILIGIFIYASCSDARAERIKPEFNKTSSMVYVKWFDKRKEMIAYLRERGHKVGPRVMAYAIWSDDDNKCAILSVRPSHVDDDDVMSVGHELLHCFIGDYHKG